MKRAASENLSESRRVLALIDIRDRVLDAVRSFFRMQGFREVTTPILVRCPGLDAYVEAVPAGPHHFLATSPELHMKRLICLGAERIYQITPAFRDDESGAHHRREFLMLEWYHTGIGYREMMKETEQLMCCVMDVCGLDPGELSFPLPRISVDRLYEHAAGWLPSEAWDEERYFLDWVNRVEPYLQTVPAIFVHDFPAELAALSRVSTVNKRTCERFELFVGGLELCNAYSELTDPETHRERFRLADSRRTAQGRRAYGTDEDFMLALETGLPECAGNALGVDRLIMALTGAGHINEVSLFPEDGFP